MTEISKVAASSTSGPYPGVPASAWAEEDKPLCECHGWPKKWQKDTRKLAGGYWRHVMPYLPRTPEQRSATAREWWATRTPEQRSATARKRNVVKAFRKVINDPHVREMNERLDPTRTKIIALLVDPAATRAEKEACWNKLKLRGGNKWLQKQTTSVETPNTPHETKSLPASASSKGG